MVVIVAMITAGQKQNDGWIGLLVTVATSVMVIFLIRNAELEKIVTSNGFYFRWKPLHRKFRLIEREEIENIEIKSFPFLSRGSGWFPGYGRYYNLSKGEGIRLHLTNGRSYYFSTAEKSSFDKALQNLISSNPKSRLSEF